MQAACLKGGAGGGVWGEEQRGAGRGRWGTSGAAGLVRKEGGGGCRALLGRRHSPGGKEREVLSS